MSAYWPWWAGAIAVGTLTPAVFLLSGRPLGVSGFWSRLLNRREQVKVAKDFTAAQDQQAFEKAILAATLAEFGERALQELAVSAPTPPSQQPAPPVPWLANATFLLSIAIGGLLALWSRGAPPPDLVSAAKDTAGAAWPALLLGGGALVGFGSRMAGGCTSGHGLSGCSTLQPASFAATLAFWVGGVAMAFLLGGS